MARHGGAVGTVAAYILAWEAIQPSIIDEAHTMTTNTATTKIPAISADDHESILTVSFSDGRVLELDASALDGTIRLKAMMHGFKQKLLDAGAIARNTATGKSATLEDKFDAVKEVYDRLTGDNPTWNKIRAEGAGAGGGLLKRALMQMTGKSAVMIEAFLQEKTKEERAALRKNPKVAEIILELQTAEADESVDTDAMLNELTGE